MTLKLKCTLEEIWSSGIAVRVECGGWSVRLEVYPSAWKYRYRITMQKDSIHASIWLPWFSWVEKLLKKLADGDELATACAVIAGAFDSRKTRLYYAELLLEQPLLHDRPPAKADVLRALNGLLLSIRYSLSEGEYIGALKKQIAVVRYGRTLARHLGSLDVERAVREIASLDIVSLAVEEAIS